MFIKRFASATKKVTIADLALEKRKREESVTKYITRWRNLSMKCEQQLTEKHAVELLLGNIDDYMAPYLAMATINTFQELLDRVAKFERLPRPRSAGFNYNNNPPGKGKQIKIYDPKRGEVNATFPSSLEKKEKEDSMNPSKMLKQIRERQRPLTLQEKIKMYVRKRFLGMH
ncbi:uncharacterized protein LOC114579064 [Dendrobium catenatum]|uniref:uncharacterized protein LOC114579064 n=1 Tax=Dendrobium catenatum TaxID=906689 RepID=UPI00109EFF2E|nr:uncharacterized protein LOC114579064 [Dendrobium catenatum]